MTFKKILIANRGEIACRIIKTARRMNISTVAIYSDIDAQSLHVQLADEAFCVGSAPSTESYLNQKAILAIAQQTQAQAIHPGYGFLAENATFAKACEQAGIIFIGPPVTAIQLMADKRAAKECMQKAGVPVIPGYNEINQKDSALQQAATQMGYPLLVKAAAGGGGKGMRLVQKAEDFLDAVHSARREAQASFGNDQLILEKYLASARHVEMQIFCDQQGQAVHLYHRDCSLQRRHQKIIEEAPAPNLPIKLTNEMAEAAIQAAKHINYVGAGTIEFLVAKNQFYFMEMNTRLQVEHPVTEMITGVDLVEWQLRIAAGESLPVTQNQITVTGHAVEARIYAEDPTHDFAPSIGRLAVFNLPEATLKIRIDSGVQQNDRISIYYDPMLAKLIAFGDDRKAAINLLRDALNESMVVGVKTNLSFLYQICQTSNFQKAKIDTHFIDEHLVNLTADIEITPELIVAAAMIQYQQQLSFTAINSDDQFSPWIKHDGWQINQSNQTAIPLWYKGTNSKITIYPGDPITAKFNNKEYKITFEKSENSITLNIDNKKFHIYFYYSNNNFYLLYQSHLIQFFNYPPRNRMQSASDNNAKLVSPMPGKVVAVLVKEKQTVNKGDRLMVLEAMKMEHTIKAPVDGVISEVCFNPGDLVNEGIELLKFEQCGKPRGMSK